MLTRNKTRFTELATKLSTEHKGVLIDDEFNKIIIYIERFLLPKVDLIKDDFWGPNNILIKGLKDQLLAVKKKQLQWTYINKPEEIDITINKIKCEVDYDVIPIKNGSDVYYNKCSDESTYVLKQNKNNINLVPLNSFCVKYKNVIVKKESIINIEQAFTEDFIEAINNIKIPKIVSGVKKKQLITKEAIQNYYEANCPYGPLFTYSKLSSGLKRDINKINNIFQIAIHTNYSSRVRGSTLIEFNKTKYITLNGKVIKNTPDYPRTSTTSLYFNSYALDKNTYDYDLYRDYYGNNKGPSFVEYNSLNNIVNYNIIEVSQTLPMEWSIGVILKPLRPLDMKWGGLQPENIVFNVVKQSDLELNFEPDIVDAINKYITNN